MGLKAGIMFSSAAEVTKGAILSVSPSGLIVSVLLLSLWPPGSSCLSQPETLSDPLDEDHKLPSFDIK